MPTAGTALTLIYLHQTADKFIAVIANVAC